MNSFEPPPAATVLMSSCAERSEAIFNNGARAKRVSESKELSGIMLSLVVDVALCLARLHQGSLASLAHLHCGHIYVRNC